MFDISSGTWNFFSPILWVDFSLSLILLIGFGVFLSRFLKRKFMMFYYGINAFAIILTWFFGLRLFWSLSLVSMVVSAVIFITVNIGEVRTLIANSLASKNLGFANKNSEKIYDRHALYSKINTAVLALSKSKTGAIITFERNVKMNDFVKSGTILNAPVTPELLMTIFYPGTRLHDGAVVIRRDFILAASVYYTPTTKPLTGKFGSRHRAAIGISEITDSVTVIVSEETGRISLAIAGELIPVNNDTFLRTFEDFMFEDEAKEKEEK